MSFISMERDDIRNVYVTCAPDDLHSVPDSHLKLLPLMFKVFPLKWCNNTKGSAGKML